MNKITAALLMFVLTASAQAVDIETLVAKQRELMLHKLDNQIKEEQSKGAKPMANLPASPPLSALPVPASFPPPALPSADAAANRLRAADNFSLMGLFGIGNDLEAHIKYRDSVLPLKIGMDIDGWRLMSIEDRSVVLVDTSSDNRGKRKRNNSDGMKTLRLYLQTVPVAQEREALLQANPLNSSNGWSPARVLPGSVIPIFREK